MKLRDEEGNLIEPTTISGEQGNIVDIKVEPTMKETEEVIDKSRRKCTLSENMQKLLLRQISAELANYSLYRTFANYYAVEGYPDLEEYYLLRAGEELNHHEWIYWYLTTNDALIQYPVVPPTVVDITDMVMPFQATIDREIETTKLIYEIVDLAFEEKDYATWNWLHGSSDKEGMLVKEQVEEESISRNFYDMATSDASWLVKAETILRTYKEGQ